MMVCLNGSRAWPARNDELARAAGECLAAGATSFHVHPRDGAGRESLDAADVSAGVAAIRAVCPGVAVGVSTGIWMVGGSAAEREARIGEWVAPLPDFASVNASEEGFAGVVRKLGGKGVEVEAGIWRPEEVGVLADVDVARVLIEVLDTPGARAVGAADAIIAALDGAGWAGERLLHGEEEACWPLIAHAGRLGLATRIGLEDTLVLPDGRPALNNTVLLRAARALWAVSGRAA